MKYLHSGDHQSSNDDVSRNEVGYRKNNYGHVIEGLKNIYMSNCHYSGLKKQNT